LRLRDSLFESDWTMPPDLDGEDHSGREQESADGHVSDGGDDHGQFGLDGIASPSDASEKCCEAEAELGNHKRQHEDRGTADGFDLGIDGEGADGGPAEDEANDDSVDDVRPPAQAMMAEHSAEKKLYVQHEDGEQGEGEQGGTALIEVDAGLLFHPFAASQHCDSNRNTKESLGHGSMCRRDERGLEKENREAAKDGLGDDRTKSADREPAQPAAPLGDQGPDGNGESEGDE